MRTGLKEGDGVDVGFPHLLILETHGAPCPLELCWLKRHVKINKNLQYIYLYMGMDVWVWEWMSMLLIYYINQQHRHPLPLSYCLIVKKKKKKRVGGGVGDLGTANVEEIIQREKNHTCARMHMQNIVSYHLFFSAADTHLPWSVRNTTCRGAQVMLSICVCTHISVNATDAHPSVRGERNGKLGVVLGFLEEVIARQSHLVHIVYLHKHTGVSSWTLCSALKCHVNALHFLTLSGEKPRDCRLKINIASVTRDTTVSWRLK